MVKKLEKIFKALGDRNRLKIVNMLTQRPMCVCEINNTLPLSQSTVSGHLKVLKEAEIVDDTKDGLWVVYNLNLEHPIVGDILKTLEKSFQSDEILLHEREKSLKADRYELCKK
jgi:ArsR family transcriptional regulator